MLTVLTAGALGVGIGMALTPVASAGESVPDGDFELGSGAWWATPNLVIDTSSGALCVDVPAGTSNRWDAIVGLNGVAIDEGTNYAFTFVTSGDPSGVARVVIGQSDAPYGTVVDKSLTLAPDATSHDLSFTAAATYPAVTGADDPAGQIGFQVGGNAQAFTFCLDDVSLTGGAEPPAPYAADTGSRVRVNQVGYLTSGPKVATVVTDATGGVEWTLRDGTGAVATGTSEPYGRDASSGLAVHTIDFSSVQAESKEYTLEADGETSHPFAIGSDLYESLRADSLALFYTQRSGIEILGNLAGAGYARAAGHLGVAPNQGDGAVTCLPRGAMTVGGADLYDGYTCDYTLDVTGGWYDAGDQGKYVVNGGIAVAQLLSTYERSLVAGTADKGALADGTLSIPEAGNGVPDILDEARWELEWMLSMQVPAGEQYAGMAHHKVHDAAWTGIPLLPSADSQKRYLHRPSTAATLNLAAAAAQGARLFDTYDPAFAAELLAAARTAYAAAVQTPNLLAPDTNTYSNPGGGPYSDSVVGDEFYWAAAELFLTTGEAQYQSAVLGSDYHVGGSAEVFSSIGFDWATVAALGRLDLATVPNQIPGHAAIVDSVVKAADQIVEIGQTQGFGQPYVGPGGRFEWGSNGKILNNLAVVATAFDLTGEQKYQQAVLTGMDYMLGRNALNLSYITGYGDVYAENMHSRWYAAQSDATLPHPPTGTVAGGPNSDVPDPTASSLLTGCAPQFCYVDDNAAYSVNELAINWNSALVFVSSFLADQDDGTVG